MKLRYLPWYLFKRRRVFLPGLVVMLIAGIGLVYWWLAERPKVTYRPVCRHNAIYQAMTLEDMGYHTRVVLFEQSPGLDHAQAQVEHNGKWYWLGQSKTLIFETRKDPWAGKVKGYWTAEQAFNCWLKHRLNGEANNE